MKLSNLLSYFSYFWNNNFLIPKKIGKVYFGLIYCIICKNPVLFLVFTSKFDFS